jgi:hypothetical protein
MRQWQDVCAHGRRPPEQQQHPAPLPAPPSQLHHLTTPHHTAHTHRHARREHDVQPRDLFFPPAVLIASVHGRFAAAWQKSCAAGRPNIVRAVIANSLWGLTWTGLLYAVSLGSQLVGPVVLQRIVAGLQCWAVHGGKGAAGAACPTEAQLY